ncbi:hypothetical protein PRZ48_008065 [Zasmidium cellare]|uniref:Uncharacterized protein n=1 Tax=Zasmidium cellare TaxID=395010 RepID=A0ABR0EEE9_ZASCE|nr:hypothetical protein PRZ48_008065 [Zasmidium cellare]
MANPERSRSRSMSRPRERPDRDRRPLEERYSRSVSARAPSHSPMSDHHDMDTNDQETQRGRSASSTSPSVEGEKDGDFRPSSTFKSQAFDKQLRRTSSRRKVVYDDDDEPATSTHGDYQTTSRPKSPAADEQIRRTSSRRKAADDDEYQPPAKKNDIGMESRKRKAGSPQVQISAKKAKTDDVQSEAGDSVIVVGASNKRADVVETTEREDSQGTGNNDTHTTASGRNPARDSRGGGSEVTPDGMISMEEHERDLEEKRTKFNDILKKHNLDNRDLASKLTYAEQDRDKYQNQALKLQIRLDRMIEQEDEWFEQVPAKANAWKKKELDREVALHKDRYDKELQKLENRMQGKFDTQETKHKKEKKESREKVRVSNEEIKEIKEKYKSLETKLRKETDQKIKESKPENQKEVREKARMIRDMQIQIEKLEAEAERIKDENETTRKYAAEQKQKCIDFENDSQRLREMRNAALDKASRADSKYRAEQRQALLWQQKLKARIEEDKQKFEFQRGQVEHAQRRDVGHQRTERIMSEQNERNNRMRKDLEAQIGGLKNQKAGLEARNGALEARNGTLERELRRSIGGQRGEEQRSSASTALARSSRSPWQDRPSASASSPPKSNTHSFQPRPDQHRHSAPDPRRGSTHQGTPYQHVTTRQAQPTGTKDPKVVEKVKEEQTEGPPTPAEAKEGGRPGNNGRVVGSERPKQEVREGGDQTRGQRLEKTRESTTASLYHQPNLFGFAGQRPEAINGDGMRSGDIPEAAAALSGPEKSIAATDGGDTMNWVRAETSAIPPKREPSASIFGGNKPTAAVEARSAQDSSDPMEGVSVEERLEAAARFVENATINAGEPGEFDTATEAKDLTPGHMLLDVQQDEAPDASFGAAGAEWQLEKAKLPWNDFENWRWQQ